MMSKVGFNEVQAYAQTHSVDFKTAAQKLGLTKSEAEALEKLGGDPGAPVDGFTKKPDKSFVLKSGRKVFFSPLYKRYAPLSTGRNFFAELKEANPCDSA